MGGRDVAGAILSIISSIISNFGVNLQKKVHLENDERAAEEKIPYNKVKRWWLGMGGVVLGAIGDFIALGLASQAVCTALGGATTLWANVAIAKIWLKEEISPWDIGGVLLIVLGAVTIAVVSPPSQEYDLAALLAKADRFVFKIYLVVLSLTVAALLGGVASSTFYRLRRSLLSIFNRPLVRRLDRMQQHEGMLLIRLEALEDAAQGQAGQELRARRHTASMRVNAEAMAAQRNANRQASAATSGAGTDMASQLELLEKEEVDRDCSLNEYEYRDWTDAYTYAACAGAIGACSVILAGCTSKTLVMAFDGNNQFDQIAPYAFIGGMVLTITGQQLLLNAALELGPIMTVFPMFQAFFIGFGVIGGIVFYETGLGSTERALHCVAALAMLAGCGCLMKHGKDFHVAAYGESMRERQQRIRASNGRWVGRPSADPSAEEFFDVLATKGQQGKRGGGKTVI
jgi:hypothetical protein